MTAELKTGPDSAFQWECQPAAAAIVGSLVDEFCQRSPAARQLQERMLRETGTRLFDWVDSIAVRGDQIDRAALTDAGFTDIEITETHRVHEHAGSAIIRARKPS